MLNVIHGLQPVILRPANLGNSADGTAVQQQSAVGAAQAETELELHLVLTVRDVTETSVTLDVWYSRVKFIQDGQGRRTVYDSMQPPPVPPAAPGPRPLR